MKQIKRNIIRRHSVDITKRGSERVRGERERKRTRVMNAPAKRDSRNEYPGNIGEHLLAENIGEHLFAKTENWNNKEVEGKRR